MVNKRCQRRRFFLADDPSGPTDSRLYYSWNKNQELVILLLDSEHY